MSNPNSTTKDQIRQQVRARLKALSPAERAAQSLAISAVLSATPEWQRAGSVLFYSARADEPDLHALMEQALVEQRSVLLPRYRVDVDSYEAARITNVDELVQGKFAVSEPGPTCSMVPMTQVDLVLVPGLAFDRGGMRLGRGRGYFDRLLAELVGKACGIAFDFQFYEAVPFEAHDRRVNLLVTSGGVRRFL